MHPGLLLVAESNVGVIDFRDEASFIARHIRHSLHIPGLVGLKSRFSWLPPPRSKTVAGKRLAVICSKAIEQDLSILLQRWNVAVFIYDHEEDFWIEAGRNDLIAFGREDVPEILFEPSPLIEMAVEACEQDSNASCATVLDLGCGAARDIAWIVRRKGTLAWRATGLDNLLATVERAKLMRTDLRLDNETGSSIEDVVWAQASMQGSLQALQLGADSKSKGVPIIPSPGGGEDASLQAFAAAHLPHHTFDLLLLIRFLPRPLLVRLPDLTHAGSIIAISHFTTVQGEQDYPSPDASKRFEESDVTMLLQQWRGDWHLRLHVIHRAEDGRPIRSVLFQRRRRPWPQDPAG